MKPSTIIFFLLFSPTLSFSLTTEDKGKLLYEARCVMCHGSDARATGPLAQKSNPPTLDLTSCAYQEKLSQCPGSIVSSIILQPNGTLIPDTLKKNGVNLPPKQWTDDDLRAINHYVLSLIHKHKCDKFPIM